MKYLKNYVVCDCVAENIVQSFFAVNDEMAKRIVLESCKNIPSTVQDSYKLYVDLLDIVLKKESRYLARIPETYSEIVEGPYQYVCSLSDLIPQDLKLISANVQEKNNA